MSKKKKNLESGGEKKEKSKKVKGVAFNLNNPIERQMFEEAEAMGGSFSSLMKYLYLAYLTRNEIGPFKMGDAPPPRDQKIDEDESTAKEIKEPDFNQDDKGMVTGMQFSLED